MSSFVIVFVLVCLAPMAVLCEDSDLWMPEEVPWPAQQCKDLGERFVGECTIPPKRPPYRNTAPCHSLKCALARPDGTFKLRRSGRVADGTICGLLKACRAGACVDIKASSIPSQTGIRTKVPCTP